MLMRAQCQAAVAVAAQALKTQLEPKSKQIKTCLKAKGGRKISLFFFPGLHFYVLFQHIKPNTKMKNSLALK